MASGDLGSLLVKIGVDTKELNSGLKQAQKDIAGFTKIVTGLLGFELGIQGLKAVAQATVGFGNELNKLSETTGLAATEIARLKFVADQSDTSVESITQSFRTLSRVLQEAHSGNAEAIQTFQKFGISFNDASGKVREAFPVYKEIADRIKNTTSETLILAEGQKLLGRNIQSQLPLLKQGADGINQLGQKYDSMREKLGLSNEQFNKFVKDSDELNDAFHQLKDALQLLAVKVLAPMIPQIKKFVDYLVNTDWKGVAANINVVVETFKTLFGWIKLGADTIATFVAGSAKFYGTLAGGGSLKQAMNAESDTWNQYLDRNNPNQNKPGGSNNPYLMPEVVSSASPTGRGIQGDPNGSFDSIKKKMQELMIKWQDVNKQIGEIFTNTMEGLANGFGQAVGRMIVDGEDFGTVLKQVWKDLAREVISQIAAMMAKYAAFLAMKSVGRLFGFPFREGGAMMRYGGMIHAANGLAMQTGPMGEAGIPAILHPNEIVTPIDKFYDFVKQISGGINITVNGSIDDPRAFAEMLSTEIDRKRRSP